MFLLYIFCLLPVLIGFLISQYNKNVNWKEWLIGSACAFLLAVPIQCWSYRSQVGDYETWSGKIVSAKQFSAWKEYYEYAVYRTEYYTESESYTDSKGNTRYRTVRKSRQVFDHWEPTSRWHNEHWMAYSNIDTSYNISKDKYLYFVKNFGNQSSIQGSRSTYEHNSRMVAGDPNDYETYLIGGSFVEPITAVKYYENRVKAARSVFNFIKINKEVPVYEYPANENHWQSDRLLGDASNKFSIRKWDEMCARLGTTKRVNVVLVGFTSLDTFLSEQQRSKWLGGKKNDLVICYGPKWAKVFGWSESDICKKNIETLFLNNERNDNLIPLIEKEINENYKKREFTEDFAFLSIEPTRTHWLTFIVLMLMSQTGLYTFFHKNEI